MEYILRATMILDELGTILLLVYNYNYMGVYSASNNDSRRVRNYMGMGYILHLTMILGKLGTIWVWGIFCI